MSTTKSPIPEGRYGVILQDDQDSDLDEIIEQVRRLGYATLDSGMTDSELKSFSNAFNNTRNAYVQQHGEDRLRRLNEFHTIRAPLIHGDPTFLNLVTNQHLLYVLGELIIGKFILNQQNGIINPPGETYNQAAWHRDLPYQHYVSSSPLAVNALFCLDDFTLENGSTYVLPASHKSVKFPSDTYIKRNALQIEAKAGQFILLDCMLFHSGGLNRTAQERRAVNHVFTIPYFKQQIKLPNQLNRNDLSELQQNLLGFNYQEPISVETYLSAR